MSGDHYRKGAGMTQDETHIALVTGANAGLGRLTALALAQAGFKVFLACRSEARTLPVLAEIRAIEGAAEPEWLALELGDFASVRACAAAFLARELPLHLLVNNAGLAGARGLTASGFEMMFGVNHLGHFLFTELLLPRLRASAPARIVMVASRAHRRVRGIDYAALRRPTSSLTGIREYGVSKLANILHASELAERLTGSGVSTFSLHPGVLDTEIWRTLPAPLRWLNGLRLSPPEDGIGTVLHCALHAPAHETGGYFSDGARTAPAPCGQEPARAVELRDWSLGATGLR